MKIIDEKLLSQFRGPGVCECCRRYVTRREPHHLLCRGMGGGNRLDHPWNLIALCAAFSGGLDCHARHHNGDGASRAELLAKISRRERVEPQAIMDELRRLQRLPKGSKV
jgi:hypothetical protein